MTRLVYILWRIVVDICALISRAFNAIVLGGSTAQTTSSRCHIDPKLQGLRNCINMVFILQEDHCADSWLSEVERAEHTLKIHGAFDD